jgi:hypothetical protein
MQFHIPDPGFYEPKAVQEHKYARLISRKASRTPPIDQKSYETGAPGWILRQKQVRMDKQLGREDVIDFRNPSQKRGRTQPALNEEPLLEGKDTQMIKTINIHSLN